MARGRRPPRASAVAGASSRLPSDPEKKARLADQLHGRSWNDLIQHLCEREGVPFDEGPLTTSLGELMQDGEPVGMHWGLRTSWPENLLLPRVLRVAQCLEQTAKAAADDARVSSYAVAIRVNMKPEPLQMEHDDVKSWMEATWKEVYELADLMKHTLAALAERDEQRRQVAALRGGANSRTPTRAVLAYLRSTHGQVTVNELQSLLRDLDLHMLPPPWDRLDRAVLTRGDVLRVTARGRPRKSWEVKWPQVLRVARSVGLLQKGGL